MRRPILVSKRLVLAPLMPDYTFLVLSLGAGPILAPTISLQIHFWIWVIQWLCGGGLDNKSKFSNQRHVVQLDKTCSFGAARLAELLDLHLTLPNISLFCTPTGNPDNSTERSVQFIANTFANSTGYCVGEECPEQNDGLPLQGQEGCGQNTGHQG